MVHGKQQKLQEQWQIVRTLYDSEDQLIDSMWNEAIQSKLFHSVCFDLTACTRNSSSSEYWAMKSRELQQHYGIVQQQEEPARDGSHICVFFLSNANNCSRNNKNHKEMRVHRTWAHKHLLPGAIQENFRFITTQSPPRILWYLDNSLICRQQIKYLLQLQGEK